MEAIVECCAGLDVHQATVVACLNSGPGNKRSRKQVRTFGTTRTDLEAMRTWLSESGCTLVAMESTGIYWRPIYAELEGHFDLIVGNAQHIKNVPGRKTDVKDCEWISDLARHGLIARSFVPPRPIRDLRDLTRYRRKLSQAQAAERNRLIRMMESANIKLSGLISDVFGVSGEAMLRALIEGEETPAAMAQHARGRMKRTTGSSVLYGFHEAQHARGRMKRKRAALAVALDGRLDEHNRFLMRAQFDRIKQAESLLEQIDGRLREKLAPYAEPMGRLMRIPGVDWITAPTIIAEIGVDMSAFASAEHLASWTGICPGNHRSAGKQKTGQVRKGNVHLKIALVTAAMGAAKTRGCYLREKHRRLRARCGEMRAHVAIAHKILVAAYHILATASDYQELGPNYLDQINERRTALQLTRRLRDMGYDVAIKPKAA